MFAICEGCKHDREDGNCTYNGEHNGNCSKYSKTKKGAEK